MKWKKGTGNHFDWTIGDSRAKASRDWCSGSDCNACKGFRRILQLFGKTGWFDATRGRTSEFRVFCRLYAN